MNEDQKIHFRELALRFLDSYNPQPEKSIVIADAILSYDGYVDETIPMRHTAHSFVSKAMRVIEKGGSEGDSVVGKWIHEWNEKFGV